MVNIIFLVSATRGEKKQATEISFRRALCVYFHGNAWLWFRLACRYLNIFSSTFIRLLDESVVRFDAMW